MIQEKNKRKPDIFVYELVERYIPRLEKPVLK